MDFYSGQYQNNQWSVQDPQTTIPHQPHMNPSHISQRSRGSNGFSEAEPNANRPFINNPFLYNTNQTEALRGAISAAAEAETHVRKGINVAQHWFPSIVMSLRYYFAVSHSSVLIKLSSLFFPLLGYRYMWSFRDKSSPQYQQSLGEESNSYVQNSSKTDIDCSYLRSDLYLPVMAFVSYILLFALTQASFEKNFHPKILSSTASFAFGVLLLETFSLYGVLYLMGISYVPVLDLLAVLCIKFLGLVFILIFRLFFHKGMNIIFKCVIVYSVACTVHATFQSLRQVESSYREQVEYSTYKSVHIQYIYISIVYALIQICLCWLFMPAVALAQ